MMPEPPSPCDAPPRDPPTSPAPLGPFVWSGLLLTAILLLFFGPTALRGQSLAEGEGVTYYLPMRELAAAAWKAGHWPAWNPFVYGGMPLLADCQAGVFYPPNMLFLVLPPVTAINVIRLAEHILSAWGMILLLRAQRASAPAALAGAVIYTFSGFMIAHMGHVSIINAAAWIPWICLTVSQWSERGGRWWLISGTLLWAVQFLAGHPQIVLYTGILVGMMLVLLAIHRRLAIRRTVAGLTLMAVVAVALSGVQLLPTLAMSAHTGRTFEPSYQLFQQYRLTIIHTPLLWIPFLFGTQDQTPLNFSWWGAWNFVEQAGYVGLLPWMLLPAAVFLPKARLRMGRGWTIIALAHLVLAWNVDTPVGRLLFHVPVYNAFESSGRHLIGMILALGMTTAIALDALRETAPDLSRRWTARGSKALIWVIGLLVVGGILGYEYAVVHLRLGLQLIPHHLAYRLRPWSQAPWAYIAPLAMAAVSAWALSRYAARPVHKRLYVLMAILFLDVASVAWLGAWRWRHESTRCPLPPKPLLAELLASPADAQAPPPRYLLFGDWATEYALNPQGNMVYRLAGLNGYGPFQLHRYHLMMSRMRHDGTLRDGGVLWPSRALDVWAGRYVIVRDLPADRVSATSVTDRPSALPGQPPDYRLVAAVDELRVFENLNAVPHAWLVNEVMVLPRADAVLTAITTGALPDGRTYEPGRLALVESMEDLARLRAKQPTTQPAGAAQVDWLEYAAHRLRLDVHAPRDATLVLAEPFIEGWSARIDGQETPIARVNYLLRGLPMSAGSHSVELTYTIPGLRKGIFMTALGGMALAAMIFWPRKGGGLQGNPVPAAPTMGTSRHANAAASAQS